MLACQGNPPPTSHNIVANLWIVQASNIIIKYGAYILIPTFIIYQIFVENYYLTTLKSSMEADDCLVKQSLTFTFKYRLYNFVTHVYR